MNIDELTLGQLKELKSVLRAEDPCRVEPFDLGKQIVVLQRGWVVVGDLSKSGMEYTLKNGSVIRTWGTTHGLGEIAMNGPTLNTVLDPISDANFHELTVILRMVCKASAWKK